MNIIHYNPFGNKTIAYYIDTLSKSMGKENVCRTVNTVMQFRAEINRQPADIVNIHGCWHDSMAIVASMAVSHGARIVVTPHGQLEPWIMRQQRFTRKLYQRLLYQRRIIARAYAVIVMGEMELRNLQILGWSHRIETIPCSLFTSSISNEGMAQLTTSVYRKVLDSNVLPLMSSTTTTALHSLFKAAITTDGRWLDDHELQAITSLEADQWRQMEIYGHHTATLSYIHKGAASVGVTPPDCRPESIACYPPRHSMGDEGWAPVEPLAANEHGQHTPDDIISMTKALQHKVRHHTFGMADVLQLSHTLFLLRTDEDEVRYQLDDKQLSKFMSRMMHIVGHFTLLSEGFYLVSPRCDYKTRRIIKSILKQLEI